jgi:hypothetical protein
MSKQTILFTIFVLMLVLAAMPSFAQKGIGVGVGSQTHVGVGGDTHVDAPGVKAGAATATDVSTHTAATVKTPDAKGGKTVNFVERIQDNPNLSAKVQTLLPSGETLSQAAAGFKNEGQFLAALHVSHNLDIPFDQLKAKMTGTDSMSLGASIKALRPDMSAAQVKEAVTQSEKEAKANEKAGDKDTDKDKDKDVKKG